MFAEKIILTIRREAVWADRPMGLLRLLLYECAHLIGNLAHALH